MTQHADTSQHIPLVWVTGWLFPGAFWDPLLAYYPHHPHTVFTFDELLMPSDATLVKILTIPKPAVIIGHSLGFMLALSTFPQHLWAAGIAIQGFCRFSYNAESWPSGTPERLLRTMERSLDINAETVVATFRHRCTGEAEQRSPIPPRDVLALGLKTLREGDERAAFAALTVPTLFLSAANDPIVSPSLIEAHRLLQPKFKIHSMSRGRHALPLLHPDACHQTIQTFLHDTSLLRHHG